MDALFIGPPFDYTNWDERFARLMLARWRELRDTIQGRPLGNETQARRDARVDECSLQIRKFMRRLNTNRVDWGN